MVFAVVVEIITFRNISREVFVEKNSNLDLFCLTSKTKFCKTIIIYESISYDILWFWLKNNKF